MESVLLAACLRSICVMVASSQSGVSPCLFQAVLLGSSSFACALAAIPRACLLCHHHKSSLLTGPQKTTNLIAWEANQFWCSLAGVITYLREWSQLSRVNYMVLAHIWTTLKECCLNRDGCNICVNGPKLITGGTKSYYFLVVLILKIYIENTFY